MADVFTQAKRSQVMSLIRSRGNKGTELVLAKLLRAHKVTGWRRHLPLRLTNDDLPGKRAVKRNPKRGAHKVRHPVFCVKPDFVFREVRLALFVDGCFWHGCPKHATRPKTNRAFWRNKLGGNMARDRRVTRCLRQSGWRVVRIWECQLQKNPLKCVRRIREVLSS